MLASDWPRLITWPDNWPLIGCDKYLVPGAPHVARYAGDEADLEHVVLVGGEGELSLLLHVLPVHEVVARRVSHHHVDLEQGIMIFYKPRLTGSSHLLSLNLGYIELSRDEDVFVDFLFQTFPEKSSHF